MYYFLFAETWSLFQTGWFDLPEEWNDPCILDTIQPLLDIREHLSDILVSEPSMEFDVMIYASSLLYTNLQVRILPELFAYYSCLLITFANILDPDHARHFVRPDLGLICLTLMVFLKEFFEKVNFEKKSRQQKA